MLLAPEPCELPLRITACGLLDRGDGFFASYGSFQQHPDFSIAKSLARSWSDKCGLPNFFDHAFGKHSLRAPMDSVVEFFAWPVQDHSASGDGRRCPLVAETGEWLTGQQADFQGANHAPPILAVDLRMCGRVQRGQLFAEFAGGLQFEFCSKRAVGRWEFREPVGQRA